MDVGVRYGLPGRLSIVKSDIKAIRAESLCKDRPNLCD